MQMLDISGLQSELDPDRPKRPLTKLPDILPFPGIGIKVPSGMMPLFTANAELLASVDDIRIQYRITVWARGQRITAEIQAELDAKTSKLFLSAEPVNVSRPKRAPPPFPELVRLSLDQVVGWHWNVVKE